VAEAEGGEEKVNPKIVAAVVPVAAKGFRRLMDRFAKKPVFKVALVRRFRTFFGLESDEDIRRAHEEMLEAVQKAADSYKKKP
jgi:hypothetical protein